MNRKLAMKTASYGAIHVMVATSIAYLLTGDFAAAAGIGLLEPIVQTGVFAIHEQLWESAPIDRCAPDERSKRDPGRARCVRSHGLLTHSNPGQARAA